MSASSLTAGAAHRKVPVYLLAELTLVSIQLTCFPVQIVNECKPFFHFFTGQFGDFSLFIFHNTSSLRPVDRKPPK